MTSAPAELRRATVLVEVKSSATVHGKYLRSLAEIAEQLEQRDEWTKISRRLIYGGRSRQRRTSGEVIPWNEIHALDWT